MSLKATLTTDRSSVVMKLAIAQTTKVGHGLLPGAAGAAGAAGVFGGATAAAVMVTVEPLAVRPVEMTLASSQAAKEGFELSLLVLG